MRLWSIQTLDVWNKLQQDGVFQSTANGMLAPSFAAPYQWMAAQLSRRVAVPPLGCTWPIWAWYQWADRDRPKPDLRASRHLARGVRGVRLELEITASSVLLSDFELWHYVLNYWYLPTSDADDTAFEHMLAHHGLSTYPPKLLPAPYHRIVTASWERIFDLEWAVEGISWPRHRKSIQAVFWELELQHVRNVDIFTAR